MKKIVIGCIILVLLGVVGIMKFMDLIDMDKRLEATQTRKQYDNEKKTTCKKKLNFDPFKENLDKMSDERYEELQKYVVEADVKTLQEYMENEKFSSEELVAFYLKRIEKFDLENFNSIIQLNPDAIMIAKELDSERKSGKLRGVLHGIPVLLKDNIGTGDKMNNTAGAKVLENSSSDTDAIIVKRLREEGAIILGKGNMSEWAYFMSGSAPSGYSALGGQTHNPYGRFDVGGSSSGSAVCVAANFSAISIGTETAGSIIYPSSQNGVVGIKPTLGLLSQDHIIPISESQDTAGPMGKTVEDAAMLLWKLTDDSKFKNINYKDYLDKNGLKNIKVGLVVNDSVTLRYRNEDKEILDRVINELEKSGAIVKMINLNEDAFNVNYSDLLKYEYKQGVENYLKIIGENAPVKIIKEIIEFNKKDMKNRAPFGQDIIEASNNSNMSEKERIELCNNNRMICSQAIDQSLEEVDVLLSLSNYLSGVYAPAGYPALTVPAGYRKSGEPVGITFVASKFEEGKLVKIAYAYEQSTKHRKQPDFSKINY